MKNRNIKFVWLAVISLLFAFSAKAQNSETKAKLPANILNLELDSKLMQRKMPYRLILPADYETSGKKYPALYLLHGLVGHFNNWGDKTKLCDYAKKYELVIVMPEGDNGWYSDAETVENDKYESYIIKELIPEIEKKFRIKKTRESRAIAGLSMGGYGSLKFGVKYPEKFVLAGSFSGALRAAEWDAKVFSERGFKPLADSIQKVYGDEGSETREQNDLFKLVKDKSAEELKSLPFFYIDCGTEDYLFPQSREFAALLLEKKIPHEFRQLPGIHNWKFWDSQVKEFLEVLEKFVK